MDDLPACGCGGEANFHVSDYGPYCFAVNCRQCNILTANYRTEALAKAAWCLAMSAPAPEMEAMREALVKARAEIWEHVETWNGLGIIAEIDAALQTVERGKA